MKLLIAGAGFIVSDFLQITKDLPKIYQRQTLLALLVHLMILIR